MEILDTPDRLGALIRARRQALGMTQRDLALAINVGERFIIDLERGKPTCQLGKALTVAKGVGIRLIDAARSESADGLSDLRPGDAYPDLPDLGDEA